MPVANAYTLDRWRVVVSGQFPQWSDSACVRIVTAPAGGIEQVVEELGLIGGTYTLNWNGTATATVNGAAVAKRGQVVLPGGTNATLRLTGGTWDRVQLEPGSLATPFDYRPPGVELFLCQRYFRHIKYSMQFFSSVGGEQILYSQGLSQRMRAAPSVGSPEADLDMAQSSANFTAYGVSFATADTINFYLSAAIGGFAQVTGYRFPLTAEL